MKRSLSITLLLPLVLTLIGCGASGIPYQEIYAKSDKALIYVYRPASFKRGAFAPDIYLNDVEMAELNSGGHLIFEVAPGSYNIKPKKSLVHMDIDGDPIVQVQAEAGEKYYLRFWVGGSVEYLGNDATGAYFGSSHQQNLVEVSSDIALPELIKTKLEYSTAK